MKERTGFFFCLLLCLLFRPGTVQAVKVELDAGSSSSSASTSVTAYSIVMHDLFEDKFFEDSDYWSDSGTQYDGLADAYQAHSAGYCNSSVAASVSVSSGSRNAYPEPGEQSIEGQEIYDIRFFVDCISWPCPAPAPDYFTIRAGYDCTLDAEGSIVWTLLPSTEAEEIGTPVIVSFRQGYSAGGLSGGTVYQFCIYDWEYGVMGQEMEGPYEIANYADPPDYGSTPEPEWEDLTIHASIGDTIKLSYKMAGYAYTQDSLVPSNLNTDGEYPTMGLSLGVWVKQKNLEITRARMISSNELGIDLSVTIPRSDPASGPWKVRFSGEINGKSFTTRDFDLTDLLEPGDTNKEIRFDYGLDPRRINFEHYEIPRFSTNERFDLNATFSGPSGVSEANKEVEILLPVIFLHGWTGEQILATIPRIYESLKNRLRDEGYTTDSDWYKTIWYERYRSKRMSPDEVSSWLDVIVTKAINSTYAERVNMIGHSLGGLVGRYYITNHVGGGKVHKLIMIGTPNKGSSAVYVQYSKKTLDWMKKLIQKSPLGQWLIPMYPALYNEEHELIPHPISNNFPDVLPGGDVTYYSIYNTAITTPSGLMVEPYRGYIEVTDPEYSQSEGDGVVPAHSSHLDGINNLPLVIPSCGHAFLPKDTLVQSQVIESLED